MPSEPIPERRVLCLTPTGSDAEVVGQLLVRSGFAVRICQDTSELAAELRIGAGAAIVAEEALASADLAFFDAALAAQPEWSDLPVILLTVAGHDARLLLERLGRPDKCHLSVLERPIRSSALVATLRTALRSRHRQYQIRDELTRRRRAEQALREVDRRKDEFLATLGHELRGPLAPLRTGIEILRRAADRQTVADTCAVLDRQTGQLTRLVDDLLDVSRIMHGRLELRRTRVELAAVLQGAVEATQTLIDAANHELRVHLPREPIVLDADSLRLAQVFANLLSNSAKYTPKGGRIEVRAELQARGVSVTVRDDGIGIPREEIDRIFEMFRQIDRSLEAGFRGLGIGLALSKSLVEKHGGRVSAFSAGVGKGSEFCVWLPVIADSRADSRVAAADGTDAHTTARPAGPRRRVLVVDDNADAARTLAQLVELLGHEAHVAFDGLEALAATERLSPHLVLLDIGLPRLNGYDVARRIRSQPKGCAVVLAALTGWGQASDRDRALDAGFDRHLAKPIELATLRELLAHLPRRGTTSGEAVH